MAQLMALSTFPLTIVGSLTLRERERRAGGGLFATHSVPHYSPLTARLHFVWESKLALMMLSVCNTGI